jgi:glycosyltransferase involved in cell wall biosynthesis
VPEVVDDGRTGFVVDETAQMAAAVAEVGELDRASCLEEHFSPEQLVAVYEQAFVRALAGA